MTVARIENFETTRNGHPTPHAIPPLSLVPGSVPLTHIRGMRFERLAAPDRQHANGLWILL